MDELQTIARAMRAKALQHRERHRIGRAAELVEFATTLEKLAAKPRTLAAACHALADELRMRRDSLPGARTIPTARAQFDLSTVERHLHGIADNMDTSPADYGDPTRPGDCLRLDHFALQRDGLQLVTDSQDVRAVVDSLSAAELDAAGLHADDVSGALVAAADGDYSEVWITEGARPFDLTGCNYARAR